MPTRVFTWTVILLAFAGSFVSFAATGSQAQFAALNYLFLMLTALVALGGLLFQPVQDGFAGPAWPRWIAGVASGVAVWAIVVSAASGRFVTAVLGEPTSLMGLGALVASAIVAAFAMRDDREVATAMSYAAPVVVAAQSLWALAQRATVVDAGHGGLANSSSWGLALVILLPWVLPPDPAPLQGKRTSPALSSLYVARFAVAFLAIAAALKAQSRVAMVLMVLIVAWYVLSRSAVTSRTKHAVLGVAAIAGLIGVAGMAFLERAGRLPFGFLTIRYTLWDTGLRAVAKRPLTGYGADGFFSAGASVTGLKPALGGIPLIFTDGTTDPHNFLVLTAVSFGVVGLVLLVVLLGGLGWRAASVRQSLDRFDAAAVSVTAGLLALLTMPITLEVLPFFALAIGLALTAPAAPAANMGSKGAVRRGSGDVREVARENRGSSLSRHPAVRWAGGAIGAVLLVLLAADAVALVALGPVSYFAPATFERALGLSHTIPFDPYLTHNVNAAFGDTVDSKQVTQNADAWRNSDSARAIVLDKRNPYYALSYAQALWNAGYPSDKVVAAYNDAVTRYPAFPSAHAELALLYATTGRADEARKELEMVSVFGDARGYPWEGTVRAAEGALSARTPQ